mgnify:CR=1 FL=1
MGVAPGADSDGLIPACAGKTWSLSSPIGSSGAHPRVCGENYRGRAGGVKEYGSSPRVRGKRVAGCCCCERAGLIPACAGKTAGALIGEGEAGAHPRVCGENSLSLRPTGSR